MSTLHTTWGKHQVELTFVMSQDLPKNYTITSTHGFCYYENKIVMVNLDKRGWDFPGGHMEGNETPEMCFAREALEEACIDGTVEMLGYVLVDNRNDPHFNPGKYPEIGCQIYYRMNVENMYDFVQDFESCERELVPIADVGAKHGNWNSIYQEILDTSKQ